MKNSDLSSWQIWAEANQLDYHSSNITKSIKGTYLECHLKLYHTHSESTRIELIQDTFALNVEEFFGEPFERKEFIALFTNGIPLPLKGFVSVKKSSGKIYCYYEQFSIENNFDYLQPLLDLLVNLINVYPKVSALGSQIISILKEIIVYESHLLRDIALSLLRNIERKTKSQFSGYNLCSTCFSRWANYEEEIQGILGPIPINYYGCRICRLSRNPLYGKKVIAKLDSKMSKESQKQEDILRVNWLSHRAMFDFEEVEIVQATDEDVERFAVQVGNDTDEVRQPRFKQMRCSVSSECQLSENTMKILQRMFGQVKIRQIDENGKVNTA